MKGKRTDPIFISQFIQESVQKGAETPDQIMDRAKNIIGLIDEEIRGMEAKKITRSKLLDVISSFEKSVKDKTEDAKMLGFFKIRDPMRCKEICELVKNFEYLPMTSWPFSSNDDTTQYNFCIKQLLEARIIIRANYQLLRGERFGEYMTFILHEDQ